MIESIHITSVATYGTTPAVLDGLSTFNYFYGANGSGKTTISRVIADAVKFPGCKVNWKARLPLEPLVYNRDFVEKHFRAAQELPGIFTLGEQNSAAIDQIEAAKKESEKLGESIAGLKKTLEGDDGRGGKIGELAVAEDSFRDVCWKQKQLHDDKLKMAFEGFRNKAEAFKGKVLAERASNRAEIKTLDYILEKAATVFADGAVRIDPLSTINGDSLLTCEQSPVLSKKIIGKSDVDIAAMIQRLGNSDWVRTGLAFLAVNDQVCPFCQQEITNVFEASLTAYFDESFEADSRAVANLFAKYVADTEALLAAIDVLLVKPSQFLDHVTLVATKKLLESHIEVNRQRLVEKKKEPSRSVELASSEELVRQMVATIADANKAITEHNKMVANLSNERQTLKDQVWLFLLEDPLRDAVNTYETKKIELEKTIANLNKQILEKQRAKEEKKEEIRALECEVTSIQPTVEAINGLLASFGFHGFSVAPAENKRCYKLLRADGTDAKDTLSEGEKTFVTFLYFYHLLKGSPSESGITSDRVVVFDDPVSSLDSDILFIVSTLIRKLCEEIRTGSTTVKQVFLLTHNVYFHKEVTFQKSRGGGVLKEETFWTIRKSRDESQVVRHSSNPIRSSYELLWLDVREARNGNLSIQNSLRRILETYFKMLGGIDLDKIHERFTGNEKLTCRALLSWVNDGSHSAHDDLYVAVDDTTVTLYLEVFKKIFDSAGHIEHYNMMIVGPPITTGAIRSLP